LGGIKTVYIANYGDVTEIEIDEASGQITGVTMSASAKFKPYQFRKQTGSMTSTLNVDETAGINYVSTELSLVFTKMETAKRLEMTALAKAQLAVIVKDSNNKYWYLGKDDYVSSTAGSGNTGTAKGDSNNYSLTLTDESDTYPFEITEAAVLAVVEE
jgi:N-methylhydantoinase B/oxoprolinase/acetone carboxylase alpha subunit